MDCGNCFIPSDVEGERRQERADYCGDNHPDFDGEGECPECEAEDARWNAGPDPDDVNDRRREQEEDNYDSSRAIL